jgi:AAA+ ATPase superfamily predicted ATPase
MFFGRQFELSELQHQYDSENFEFPVIYGRRRVGKTELVSEFIKDKKAIYIQGIVGTATQNLENLASAIYEFRYGNTNVALHYERFEDALEDITQIMQDEKVIFVIDEFPYLAESFPSISSLLQMYIDQKWQQTDSMLILCGSSMSFIEKQVLSYQSPLYGRRMTRYKILPFDFKECLEFLPEVSKEDALAFYAVTSGIPYYLSMINRSLSFLDNVRQLFLQRNSILLEEPLNLLNMEVKEPSSYMAVLSAIAGGSSKHNEIATKANLTSSLTSKLLENLMELGIVEKKQPILVGGNRGLYFIKDNLYRFWFTFISKNLNFIQSGRIRAVESLIANQLNHFLGSIFEDICREWLLDESENGHLVFPLTEIGSWWGGNPKTKQQEEIDILATGNQATELLVGECKWQNQTISLEVAEKLLERAGLFSQSNKIVYLFSKVSFSKEMADFAKENQIHLVNFDAM